MNFDATVNYYNHPNRLPGSQAFNYNYGLPRNMNPRNVNNLTSVLRNTYPNNIYNQGYIQYNQPVAGQNILLPNVFDQCL